MKEQQVDRIQTLVAAYLAGGESSNILSEDSFADLVEHVHGNLADVLAAGLEQDELCCLTAMCALGPAHDGVPPEGLREQLLGIVRQYAGGNPRRVAELAVAFGCGKWRTVDRSGRVWHGEWDRAVIALVSAIRPFVKAANIWLAERVVGFPRREFWGAGEGKLLIRADSAYLAVRIMRPQSTIRIETGQVLEIASMDDGVQYCVRGDGPNSLELEGFIPAGAKLVFENGSTAHMISGEHPGADRRVLDAGTRTVVLARDGDCWISFPDGPAGRKSPRITLKAGTVSTISGPVLLRIWECTCGHEKCAARHRLDAWQPGGRITLRSFLASAVKGPEPRIKVGSFTAGMYYPLLAQDGGANATRVRTGPVEYALCGNQDCISPSESRRYEGDLCPYCKTHFNPANTYRKSFNYLMAMDDCGTYQRQARMQCSGELHSGGRKTRCSNLYSESLDECPVCGHRPRVRRPTMIWVRSFTRRIGDGEFARIGTDDFPGAESECSDSATRENGE